MSKQRDYANEVYEAALALGIPEVQARLAAAQSSVETGYGKHAPGNAYFGIKAGPSWDGPTQTLSTREEIGGKDTTIKAAFRSYDDAKDSLSDWWATLQKKWPDAASATNLPDAIAGLKTGVHGAYATDSDYSKIVNYVDKTYLPPRPPMNIPGVASAISTNPAMALAGGAARAAPPPLPRPRPDPKPFKPLPFPGMLKAPPAPVTRVASTDSYIPAASSFTLPPPSSPLNPPMPPRPTTSWVGRARPTVQRQPAPVQTPPKAPAAPILTAAQRSAMSAVPAGTPMTVRPTNTLPNVGALAGAVAGAVPKKVAPMPMARPAAMSMPSAAVMAPPMPMRRPTPVPPQTIPPTVAPPAPSGGNFFTNILGNAQATFGSATSGVGNAFNSVKTAAAPVISNVGNALKDDAIAAVIGTKAGRTMVIDGAMAKAMNGRPKPAPPPGKPAGFGSKGYSAEGLALKNMFRKKK